MCLLPSFYKPETEELRWSSHYNVRKLLFFNTFRSIKYCEFKRLKGDDSSFELLEIVSDALSEGWMDKAIEKYWSKEKANGKLI